MDLHAPPAAVDDFDRRPALTARMRRGWDAVVDRWLAEAALIYGCDDSPSMFYHPHGEPAADRATRAPIVWDAFPRALVNWFRGESGLDRKRWAAADTLRPRSALRFVDEQGAPLGPVPALYRQQDEYCEWAVVRSGGRIRRIVFTSEGPEYWRFLAHGTAAFFPATDPRAELFAGDLGLVEELYREHVDDSVRVGDLLWEHDVQQLVGVDRNGQQVWLPYARRGAYNPLNPWNTLENAMHLTHPSNFLGAQIHLAGGASVARQGPDGRLVTGAHRLICCAGFGSPNRSSDPLIGKHVNDLTRQGLSVSIAEPVGLYIADVDEGRFRGPTPGDTAGAWRVTRGDRDSRRILRAVFEPPSGMDRITVDGKPISYGGQVADAVQMELVASALALGVPSRPRGVLTGCCRHPDRPDFFAFPGRGQACDDIRWDRYAPTTPPGIGRSRPAAGPEPVEGRR